MADMSELERMRRLLAERMRSSTEALPDLPPAPASVAASGLRESFLIELVVKLLYIRGNLQGREICDAVGLPYQGLMEQILRGIKDEMYAAVLRGDSVRESTIRHVSGLVDMEVPDFDVDLAVSLVRR